MADVQQVTVRTAVAPLLADARISSAIASQLMCGDLLTVMDGRGDWLQVRGADGYEGWTHIGYVTPSTGDEREWRWSLGCQVRDASGITRGMPLGARIEPTAELIRGDAMTADERAAQFPLESDAIARSAETRYAGASYVWGGVTPWGCDCSGFVQRIFLLHGVQLPRDAWQQAMAGSDTHRHMDDEHTPGDLLFFSDRDDQRVTHVGVALEGRRMVHSALMRGGVAIELLSSADPYVARLRSQCVGVRRML